MEWGVGDPWVLRPKCVTKSSPGYTWQNKCEKRPIWQRLDRFHLPVQWMPRVGSTTVLVGPYKSDHLPVKVDLALREEDVREHRSSALRFFRVNQDVARSETGAAGVRDILKKWSASETEGDALRKLEKALGECRTFLRELGKEMAKQRRQRETARSGVLESLLLRIPDAEEDQLEVLQTQINEAARQLTNMEESKVKGHQIRAGLKWEIEGDRPSSFFFQKV